MYGSVARIRITPGFEEEFTRLNDESASAIPGLLFEYFFRSEAEPEVTTLVVGFESKAAYLANANDPEQHRRYERLRALLVADPEWSDGEIFYAFTG